MLINNSKKIVIKLGSSTVIDKKGKFNGKLLPRQVEPYKNGIEHIKKYSTTNKKYG